MTRRAHIPVYKGPVKDGPWKGQYIEADNSVVSHNTLKGGHYSHDDGGWIWLAPCPDGEEDKR